MLLFNETGQQLDAGALTAELLKADNSPAPTLEELKADLGNYYHQALITDLNSNNVKSASFENTIAADANSFLSIGGSIFDKIKKAICKILNGSSTTQEIINAILTALASIIPGGVIVKGIVQKLVKYILSAGIAKFCKI